MMTGVYAARNIMGGHYDVWGVNTEKEYHEEERDGSARVGDRMVPSRVPGTIGETAGWVEEEEFEEEVIEEVFARLDPVALGVAVGVVSGLCIFLATAILLIKGGPLVGPTLSLLGQFLFGFQVTWGGALIGLIEGGLGGFTIGYVTARLRNWGMKTYGEFIRRRGEAANRRNLLDKV